MVVEWVFFDKIEWGSVTRLLSQMVPIFTFSLGIASRNIGKSEDFHTEIPSSTVIKYGNGASPIYR